MSQRTDVDPAALRACAGACDDIARTLKGPADRAVEEAGTAGGSLTGWSVGSALTEISAGWKPALDGLRARIQAGGENLRSSADGHEWNDQAVSQDFERTGAGTSTQAVPGVMPAVLRPGPGEHHPVGHPGGAQGSDPGGRPSDGGPPDPRTSYGTTMPTYDGSVGTRPTPGGNVFG
ncbi:hypothetical protein SUDANB6_01821 [Streptomyces sp. enrichment culture]|uniref:WXG100 family type VII secretion target n=1 Tax=Streptomyces sp. enrichment culture TaxID=1795815 RepID=UPI003F56BBB4